MHKGALVLVVVLVMVVACSALEEAEPQPMPVYLPRKRCEICVTVVMRKLAQVDHLCQGMEHYFETCNDVIASMLHWYPNFIYWSWSGGCDMHMPDGITKRVRPCPAHAICAWLTSPSYHVGFCPWDSTFRAPGLEDSLYPFAPRPSDNMPPLGGPQGIAGTIMR
eukprot:c20465_g1_i1.p1 GENE.c20465_g1_i1~~c20465_g1_i1.p1  ORF type:complete len:165 (-),score=51.24 c20465_g1_i1:59-553(-)